MPGEKIVYNLQHVEVNIMPKGKRHRAQLKLKVALKAAGSSKTLCQLVSEYKLHARQIGKWKHQLLGKGDRKGASIFSSTTAR